MKILIKISLFIENLFNYDYFGPFSSEVVNFQRPAARRRANTLRPFLVDIRSRKPCLLARFLLEG
jgi:hypothetical protein